MPPSEIDALRQLQALVARALTQPGLDREIAGRLGSSVASIPEEQLIGARETLMRKRISQTASVLPLSIAMLGDHYRALFREFAEQHHFGGKHAIFREAIEFARWLAKRIPDPVWLKDCLIWESIRCQLAIHRWWIRPFVLKHNVPKWLESDRSMPPAPIRCCIVAWRLGRRSRVHVWSLRHSTRAVRSG